MAIADQPLILDLGEGGPTVWLEAVPAIVRESGSTLTPSMHSQRVEKISTRAISEVVNGVARRLREELRAEDPDRVSLSFALSVDTGGRVVIGAQGTVRVNLEWRKDDASSSR
jgi:hypothetical protein